MPLLDHFRPPLAPGRSWESFHSRWAVAIGNHLNRKLPRRFVAETQVHLGARVEADTAEFDTEPLASVNGVGRHDEPGNGVAVATEVVAPPQLTLSVPHGLVDRIAVEVRDRDRDFRLAGGVELVSPGNKDRADARQMFVGKAAGYVLTGVGLVVADVVTTRAANLHNDLLALHGAGPEQLMPESPATYAAAYAPVPSPGRIELRVWCQPLAVGTNLPVLPLRLLGFGPVLVDLNGTYHEACEWSRLP